MVLRKTIRFERIEIVMNDCAVHVTSDEALKEYMGMHLGKALILAEHIKEQYQEFFEKELRITTMSLAVELIGHYAMQELCLWIKKHFSGGRSGRNGITIFCDKILHHTDIIDCGERHCDNNRFVWDILAVPAKLYRVKK